MSALKINYKEDSEKVIKDLKVLYPAIREITAIEEDSLIEVNLFIKSYRLSRCFKDWQDIYCWLDGIRIGLQAAGLMASPTGPTLFF